MKFNGKYILSKEQKETYSELWKGLTIPSPVLSRHGGVTKNQERVQCSQRSCSHDNPGPKGERGQPGFKKIKGQSGAIDFSVKIVSLLGEKQKAHNKKNNQRIRLNDLKRVYVRGAEMFTPNKECDPRSVYAMARVNMLLRIKEEGFRSGLKIKSHKDLVIAIKNGIDVTESWSPEKDDLDKAYEDIKAHRLYFDFDNVNELFLESERDNAQRLINW